MEKYKNLDGLRGLAALIVVFCHYSNAFFPSIHGRQLAATHTRYDQLIATTPLHLLFAGDFAVAVFFVLSGFVLSQKFFRTKSQSVIVSSATRRYFRLAIPVVGSVLLSFLLLRIGFMQRQYMNQAPMPSDWSFVPNIFQALYQGLYGAFFTTNLTTYNPVLWTMQVELIGSFIIFLFLALFGKLEKRWIFYILFGIVTLKTNYLGFILGMLLSDIWVNRQDLVAKVSKARALYLLCIGLLLGAWYTSNIYPSVYGRLSMPFFSGSDLALIAHAVGAACLIVAVLKLSWLTEVLQTRTFQFLGKISFSLYLIHFIILGSLGSFMFNHLYYRVGYSASIIITSVFSIAVTLAASSLYTRQIDERAIAWSKVIGDWILRPTKQRQLQASSQADNNRTDSTNEAVPLPTASTSAVAID